MYLLFVIYYLFNRPAFGASHFAPNASHLQFSYIVTLLKFLLTNTECVVLCMCKYSIGDEMSVRNRKYRSMTTDEVCRDFISKSKSSIHSLLLHYKAVGDDEMLVKLKTAYELAKIERARLKLQVKEHEITTNLTK